MCIDSAFSPIWFQSTLPRRERLVPLLILRCLYSVSIHAPAKGATFCDTHCCMLDSEFQSTLPRRERRIIPRDKIDEVFRFNPRSREGSDIEPTAKVPQIFGFNPRSREGSD